MRIQKFDDILAAAAQCKEKRTVAVACAADEDVLTAVVQAKRAGVAEAILIGDAARIAALLPGVGAQPEEFEILQAQQEQEAAQMAVACVREGRAALLMKGLLGTATLLRAVLARDTGISQGGLMSHLMFYEPPGHKLFCLTDGGLNPFPELEKKEQILQNAAEALQRLGYCRMTAACVCGAEVVNPKISSNLDAQALCAQNARWQRDYGMTVYGPVGLDLAVSKEAVRHKHYGVACAGEADILLVPNYEVGNGVGKALTLFAGAKNAGVVVGARVPIVLTSRADSAQSKLASIALGCLLA